jgi:diguanylate cyclase (GGDEF)-like protein
LLSQAVLLNVRMVAVVTTPMLSDRDFLHSPAFGVMAFGTVLYTITLAFLLLSMTKERSELRHKIAALIDPLTGLANRRAFMSDADTMIAQRASRSEPIAVLLADLDHFKKINDVHGHSCGDRVLKLFAAALDRCIAQDDLAGRIGGEEFAVLLTDRSEEAALAFAERLRCAFAEAAIEIDGRAIRATVSVGVAVSRIGAHDLASLLARADQALYRAKASGRNRVAAFSPEPVADEAPSAVVTPLRRLAAAG